MQTNNTNSDVTSTPSLSEQQRLLIPRSHRRRFFLRFTILTLLGWVVGGIASMALEKILVETVPPSVFSQHPTWYTFGKSLSSGLIFAFIFGADQAIALRRYLSGWLWLLATSFGWLIADSVSKAWIRNITNIATSSTLTLSSNEPLILSLLSTFLYIFSGIWLGFCQFIVLRRYTAGAWWWNFLPSISFFFISMLIFLLSLVQDFIPEANRTQILYLSGQGFTAVILGVIPAIGLCRLKRTISHTKKSSSS